MPQLSPSSLTSSVPSVSSSSLPSLGEVNLSLLVEANTEFTPPDTPRVNFPSTNPDPAETSSIPLVGPSSLPREDSLTLLVEASAEFPPGHIPGIDFPSSIPPTENHPTVHEIDTRTAHPLQQSNHRFHPYASPTRASLLDLRIASRSLGLSPRSGIQLEDLQRGKDYFLSALSDMPHSILKHAYESKLADRECYAYRVALSMAEINSCKRRLTLLESIRDYRERDAKVNEEQIILLEDLLGLRHVTVDDMIGDKHLQGANEEDGLVELGVVDKEVSYLGELIQSQDGNGRSMGPLSNE